MCIVYEFNQFSNKDAKDKVTVRIVKLTRAFDDYTFATVAPVRRPNKQYTIAVPVNEDKFDMDRGDVIRFKTTSLTTRHSLGQSQPVPVVCKTEPIKGEVIVAPVVQVVYQKGHQYARATI